MREKQTPITYARPSAGATVNASSERRTVLNIITVPAK
jgi:hypothetical protein